MPAPRKTSSASASASASAPAIETASATALPPDGFALLLVTRLSTGQLSAADIPGQLEEYKAKQAGRRGADGAIRSMSSYLGRLISAAQSLSPHLK